MTTKEIGSLGENAAAEYLVKNGYKILERNYSIRGGEIDIIAKKDGCTVFAEVKTRKNTNYGRPCEYVNYEKQRRIKRTAVYYLRTVDAPMRFDVIEVLYFIKDGEFKIKSVNHIINAF